MPDRICKNIVCEKRRAIKRRRLAAFRTRSSHPWALIGCSRQPVVLQTASRSLPDTPVTEIIRNTSNNYLPPSPVSAGCLPARTRYLPLVRQESIRMKQPSFGKRRRFAAFRTTICREQMMSDQGWLERVLKAANRLRLMARRFSQTMFLQILSGTF